MLTPGRIFPGTTVTLTASFVDAAGIASDPTTVVFKTCSPSQSIKTYTYGAGTIVTKTAVGSYQATVTPDQGGRWSIRWETTGGVVATEDDFIVQKSPFVRGFIGDYV